MRKRGILWKIRKTENEIAVAEDRGCLVKTYSCSVSVFTQIEETNMVEGAFIVFNFDVYSRLVVEVTHYQMKGHVCKWTDRFAVVRATIVPQIKLCRNGRLSECKFITHPTERVASAYISNTEDLGFQLENNQYVSFNLAVNMKSRENTKHRDLRNAPYLGLVATHVQLIEGAEHDEDPDIAPKAQVDPVPDNRVNDWFSRRMSSPRKPALTRLGNEFKRKPSAKRDSRRRGNSNPTSDKLSKRDPASAKYAGPSKETASAPATPLQKDDMISQDLPESYNDFVAKFKNTSQQEGSKNQREERCLRCGKDTICTHRPPRTRENVDASPKKPIEKPIENADQSDEQKRLQDENEILKRELEKLRLQLANNAKTEPKKEEVRDPPRRLSLSKVNEDAYPAYMLPEKNCSYSLPYDVFDPSPPVSPSVSPELPVEYGPESFHESFHDEYYFVCGGKPSSARSDILSSRSLRKPSPQYVNKTPLIDALLYPPSKFDKLSMSDTRSATSSASTHSTNYSYYDYDSNSFFFLIVYDK
jgi:hypothetical protein